MESNISEAGPKNDSENNSGASQEKEKIKEMHYHHYDHCQHPGFNFGKFFLGFFLVLLGLAYLARNAGWLPFEFNINIWQLWPLLVIFAGLSLLSGRNWVGIILGLIITFLIIALVGALIVTGHFHGGFMLHRYY